MSEIFNDNGNTKIYFLLQSVYDGLSASTVWTGNGFVIEGATKMKDFKLTGLDSDTSTDQYLGNATVTYASSTNPAVISASVRFPTDATNKLMWETMRFGSGLKSDGSAVAQVIGLELVTADSETRKIEFKNATMTKFEPRMEAGSYFQADVEFTVSATDVDGNPNIDFASTFTTA